MSVPFLPLFNVNSGPSMTSPGTTAGVSGSGGGESFAQAMSRLQSHGREGGSADPHEPTLLSASDPVLSLEFSPELPPGGLAATTVVGKAFDEAGFFSFNSPALAEELAGFEGDSELDSESWTLIPGLYGAPMAPQPINPAGTDESLPAKLYSGGEGILPGVQFNAGLARPSAEQRPPTGTLEAGHWVPDQIKPMPGPGEVTAQGAFKLAAGDLELRQSAETLERSRGGEEQKLAISELKTVLHAERSVAAPASAAEGARAAVPVQVAFGLPQWATQVAERTAMLASQNIQHAELKLDPPELGPLNVRISVNQEQASVHFVSANASVREALDQSVARLKELLQEQGLDLVDSGVSDQGPQKEDSQESTPGERSLAAGSDAGDEPADEDSVVQTTTLNSGIDDFV